LTKAVTLLYRYSKAEFGVKANELSFVRDTLEKVLRLADILKYLNTNPLTAETLALKGGTAINLTVFNLPRLSVDIDLDYVINNTREEMLRKRELISTDIKTYMTTQAYALSPKSKTRHSLDSLVFTYENLGGMNDNIKIEINYSLRAHLFEPECRAIMTDAIEANKTIYCVAPMEIFAAKINALLSRSAARDLYDVHNMIRLGLFGESERDLLRKSVVFYTAISQEDVWQEYSTKRIDSITTQKIKTDLLLVIRKGEFVELAAVKDEVKSFVAELMMLTDNEKAFLQAFERNEYKPELLFADEMLERVRNHPMALWKMRER